jgi:hypothetical protein
VDAHTLSSVADTANAVRRTRQRCLACSSCLCWSAVRSGPAQSDDFHASRWRACSSLRGALANRRPGRRLPRLLPTEILRWRHEAAGRQVRMRNGIRRCRRRWLTGQQRPAADGLLDRSQRREYVGDTRPAFLAVASEPTAVRPVRWLLLGLYTPPTRPTLARMIASARAVAGSSVSGIPTVDPTLRTEPREGYSISKSGLAAACWRISCTPASLLSTPWPPPWV